MSKNIVVAWDTETGLIGDGGVIPDLVCASFSTENGRGQMETILLSVEDALEETLFSLLTNENVTLVTHAGQFDYTVVMRRYPKLIPFVWKALVDGRCSDTLIREKMLALSNQGRLAVVEIEGGGDVRVDYSLAGLEMKCLGVDRSSEKTDPNGWRLRYIELKGHKAAEFPAEAAKYAREDAEGTLSVWRAQEEVNGSVETERFHLAAAVALKVMQGYGITVDPEATDDLQAQVEKVLEETLAPLEAAGIIRGQDAGEPYKRDMEKALEILAVAEPPEDWGPYREDLEALGIKFKGPRHKAGSTDTKRLQEYVGALCKRLGHIPEETDKGDIKLDSECLGFYGQHDETLAVLRDRKSVAKLHTQIIPVLRMGATVHPDYNPVLESGRTSSYDGGRPKRAGEERKYPSVNIQQIPGSLRGLDPRMCFAPRWGTVFWDVDYSGLELACVGYVTHRLFGESVHRDLYNAGCDLHAYLGAQLAVRTGGTPEAREFAEHCRGHGILDDPMKVYEEFRLCKREEDLAPFYKHFRTFAKPVGLGFPGGLGPATMVGFARATYGVEMSEDDAREFREIWRETYPEMPRFFEWVETQVDHVNSSDMETVYKYTTPLGMVRAGATFCSAANGMSMQSPGAEAAKAGLINVVMACTDESQGSVLYGCKPLAFIHDQILGETTQDKSLWEAQCAEVSRLMIKGAESVLDTIKIRTEALLTTRWSKSAEPTYNEEGTLIPWVPK